MENQQNQIQNLGSGVVSSNNRILVYATDAAGSDMSYEQKSLSGFSNRKKKGIIKQRILDNISNYPLVEEYYNKTKN